MEAGWSLSNELFLLDMPIQSFLVVVVGMYTDSGRETRLLLVLVVVIVDVGVVVGVVVVVVVVIVKLLLTVPVLG